MPHMIPAYEFRRRAREAMKAVMPLLLIAALIAALPSLISSTVTILTEADPNTVLNTFTDRLMQVVEKHTPTMAEDAAQIDQTLLMKDTLEVLAQYETDMMTFIREKGLIVLGLALMVMVCSPVLTLGLNNALLHALRRQPFEATIAFSRLHCLLRVLGLMLLVALKTLLWMLPGMAISILSIFLPELLSGLAMVAGMIAAVIMGVMASFRYAMCTFVMADEPATRVIDCIRRSKEVMQRRKMELFSLEISFIGWHLLLSMVQTMLLSFGAVIGLTLGMFASLFLTVYTNCAKAAFYQEYTVGPLPEAGNAQNELLNE